MCVLKELRLLNIAPLPLVLLIWLDQLELRLKHMLLLREYFLNWLNLKLFGRLTDLKHWLLILDLLTESLFGLLCWQALVFINQRFYQRLLVLGIHEELYLILFCNRNIWLVLKYNYSWKLVCSCHSSCESSLNLHLETSQLFIVLLDGHVLVLLVNTAVEIWLRFDGLLRSGLPWLVAAVLLIVGSK
jgi:hypothetical protein